ncbi:unnamed protein product [Arctia plantaginis]|uniref:Oxidoreductase-like domain-containing protein n=1 Tax=Arctia plantaginis TaxID=874455 RepID=A0A8S1B3C4_ARCPL|nr:unnamed protein product [Arctia plantaginis]
MLKFILRPPDIFKYQNCITRTCITNSSKPADDEKERELERIANNASIDSPPTTCCQSGCANCVYIAWADALSAKMEGDAEIAEKIIKMVDDPSMKAYLEMELRLRSLKKK